MIADTVFKQYDLRGIIGSEFPLEEVYKLGKAIAYYFVQQFPQVKTVAVGADGRTHSPIIKEKLCAALQESGLDVLFVGICPTPVLYFSLFTQPVQAGLMITASHNGKEYNGIKICLNKESVWGQQIQEIKKLYKEGACLKPEKNGLYQEKNVIDEYISWLKNHFSHLVGMKISVVIDCANGAAGTVLPKLITAMKWPHVTLLFPEVDGTYPNHEADPIVEKNMQEVKKILLATDTEVGIGLDGDCDRMAPMTKKGELIHGDKLLALFAQSILKDFPGSTVVFDIKCSSGLPELLQKWGARPIMSPSGHSIIKNQMKQQNAVLAGELSCHFFFKDRYFGYDDGIYAILRLFELLVQSHKTLDELVSIFPKKYSTVEIRIECADNQKNVIVEQVKEEFEKIPEVHVMTIDGIRVTMKDGWGMLRSSNTQPVLCLRFEANSPAALKTIKEEFVRYLKPYFSNTVLQEIMTAS